LVLIECLTMGFWGFDFRVILKRWVRFGDWVGPGFGNIKGGGLVLFDGPAVKGLVYIYFGLSGQWIRFVLAM
jgi:hypothetical protein